MKILLASGSPRRKEILTALGYDFDIFVTDADETTEERDPARLVELLAHRKAEAAKAAVGTTDAVILAADTVVAADGEILGKPADAADAERMLRLLSGKEHKVMTGICLIAGETILVSHDETKVFFKTLDDRDIEDYLATGEPFGKAGAYAVQGIAGKFVDHIEGSFSNVVGLSEELLTDMLQKIGVLL